MFVTPESYINSVFEENVFEPVGLMGISRWLRGFDCQVLINAKIENLEEINHLDNGNEKGEEEDEVEDKEATALTLIPGNPVLTILE